MIRIEARDSKKTFRLPVLIEVPQAQDRRLVDCDRPDRKTDTAALLRAWLAC